ncbi:MAG: acetate--CoA ligase family protein [Elusimicrobia bacterium]|nr:acetate--CoA ligase family protein [Candidatus Obscuribacterium magneticum]
MNLSSVIAPKSVAVIGASEREGTVGEAIFKNLLQTKFKGALYPVNPKAKAISGVKCFPSVAQIGEPIDLAVIIIPSSAVPDVLKECAAAHIPGVIVISAGFKEVGGVGVELENQVKQIAEENGIALVGPNCLGFINTDPLVQLNASFAKTMPEAGNIAFISQSGALCTAVLDYAKGEGIGFSKFISMGNKAVTNEVDFLRTLRDDPMTDVILMYVEDITDAQAFLQISRQITGDLPKPKPIIAIKSGRTQEGAKAASSHTGSLAGSDEVYDAFFHQCGVMRVETVDELFDYAIAFSRQPLPKGDRIAIITNAGGPGIMATDAAIRYGLKLAPLEEETKNELRKVLPPTANFNNPIDVIGDAHHDRYEAAIRTVLKDPNVDGMLVILTPQAMTDIREIGEVVAGICESMKVSPWMAKPLIASFMGIVDVSEGVAVLEKAHVPHYIFPESGARALAAMYKYKHDWIERPRTDVQHYPVQKDLVRKIFDRVRSENRLYLPEYEALKVFVAYGFPVAESYLAKTEEDAVKFAGELGYPVVAKIVSPEIVHKLDAGGVIVNLKDAAELSQAFRRIMDTASTLVGRDKIWGVEIQKMAGKGIEVFMGSKRDPKFGPAIVFGLGGTYVEVLRDISLRIAPLRELAIEHMMESSKVYRLLQGYRGQPADIDKVKECLGRLSQLVMDFPEIEELDVNPLIVYPVGNGARILDGRLLLSKI